MGLSEEGIFDEEVAAADGLELVEVSDQNDQFAAEGPVESPGSPHDGIHLD